ncbi:MAG: T9SS type A sorting domain-containing protein [Bacteroidota bacterium]
MKKITLYSAFILSLSVCMNVASQKSDQPSGYDLVEPNITQNVVSLGNEILDPVGGGPFYDNGPWFNVEGNPNLSIVENLTLGTITRGFNASETFRVVDEATLTSGWEVTSIRFFVYQTGAPTNPSPIQEGFLQIWDDDPSNGGSVIWGDTSTNLLDATQWSETYRVLEDEQTDTNRAIMEVDFLTPDLQLAPGTYWLDWSFIGDAAFGTCWQPTIAILGTASTGNALQFDGLNNIWFLAADGSSGDLLGFPFQMFGELLGVDDNPLERVSLFPNPADKEVTLSNPSNIGLERLLVFDVMGKQVLDMNVSDITSQITIDVSGLKSGIYMVQIQSANGSTTKRMVKR